MSQDTPTQELCIPSQPEIDGDPLAYYYEENPLDGWCGDHGGAGIITGFERDVQSLFNDLDVTYQNEYAANTSNGWTFLDRDGDGWYDHIERASGQGIFIYCGDGTWVPLL